MGDNIEELALIRKMEAIPNKNQITSYLAGKQISKLDVDAIDISGFVLASEEWGEYCRNIANKIPMGSWRVALLEPDSQGAVIRANESTVWRGNLQKLNDNIHERSRRIEKLAKELGIKLDIQYYDSIPVTRYMKVDHIVFESYYPHDKTGAKTPILILPEESILRKRVEKEFAVLWMKLCRDKK